MKFACVLVCAFAMAAMANAQKPPQFNFSPPDNSKYIPKISGGGGGSPKQGYDVSFDVQQRVFESQNGRHSVDVGVGHSQHFGGPYGNSQPQYRGSVGYTLRFK